MKVNKAWCFFEQSGTFKNEFMKLGIPAVDLDIQNNFGQTDYVIDLFAEIEKAYEEKPSIFDGITSDDLIFAFFPCIYFSQQNSTFFDGTNWNWKGKDSKFKAEQILIRSRERQHFYEVALKMFTVCDIRGLKLIVENPYTTIHYLYNNFPYKPEIIDRNRQLRGDYFVKPTAYWFFSCKPTNGKSYQCDKTKKIIGNCKPSGNAGVCSEERSMISPDYARNFICDFIIGKEQKHTLRDLFN